ncbi:hypothetical protein AC579_1387 [Pseudocercospora musae]|uniref:F-box domain-containing protein n=1 Tax=Pseudocercospora musae TaxID=113226 RepID=A0A139IFR6_9PEZI|nr:hypothetical protein AC579_1387 [Pseudocercospora musae]
MSRILKSYLESLPQELYDEIRSLVFKPLEPEEVIHITPCYKPPAVTLINRHLRAQNLPIFNTWIFIGNDVDLPLWLTSREEDEKVCYDVRCWAMRRKKGGAKASESARAVVRNTAWRAFQRRLKECECIFGVEFYVYEDQAIAGKGSVMDCCTI